MKLLESSIIQYDKLKFDSQEKAVHPILIISMAAMDLGWDFVVEKDQEEIRGLCVGTKEYVQRIDFKKK